MFNTSHYMLDAMANMFNNFKDSLFKLNLIFLENYLVFH